MPMRLVRLSLRRSSGLPKGAVSRPPSLAGVLHATLTAACLAGCADLLGLENLEFEQTSEEQTTAQPGGGGGTGFVVPGTGGAPPSLDELWGFPANWPEAMIVAAQPPPFSGVPSAEERASSSFHVYQPASGLLTSYRLTTDGREIATSQWVPKEAPHFSYVVLRPGAEALGLFGYYASTGRSEHAASFDPWNADWQSDPPRSLVTREYTGSAGWTHAVTLRHADGWRFLQYNQWDEELGMALYRMSLADVVRAEAENISAVGGPWEAGWSSLLAYDLGDGEHGVLKFNAETGVAELDRLSEDGWELSTVARSEWGLGWTHAITFLAEGEPQVVLYDAALGTVALGRLDEELDFEVLESGLWETGWTSMTLFEVDGEGYVLNHNAATGEARVSPVPRIEYTVVR